MHALPSLRLGRGPLLRQARYLSVQPSEVFDVAIVGAGMIGSALAAALGGSGCYQLEGFQNKTPKLIFGTVCRRQSPHVSNENCAVGQTGAVAGSAYDALFNFSCFQSNFRSFSADVMQAPADTNLPLPPVPESRVSTITPATISLLQQTGSWSELQPPTSTAFSTMQVWDSAGSGHVEYHADLLGADSLGHVVENSALIRALSRRLPAALTSLQPVRPCTSSRMLS